MALRVAITAVAVRTALGDSADDTWQAIRDGRSAIGPIQGFDASGFGAVEAAQIWTEAETPEDDPALRILGPHGRLLDAVALEAHAQAGLDSLAREDVGLFVGMGMVDSPIDDLKAAALAARNGGAALSLASFFAGSYRQIHPLWPLSMLNNVAVGQIAIDLDIRGDNAVFAADGAAGVRALLEAAHAVEEGSCRAALAAGVSGRITPQSLARRRLERRDAPPGEGGAALILEREQDAHARGATILGFVRGGATAVGSPTDRRLHPAREAVKRVIQRTGIGTVDDLALDGAGPLPFGDLGAASAATLVALQLAAWSATRASEEGARRTLIVTGGNGSGGALAIEEAA